MSLENIKGKIMILGEKIYTDFFFKYFSTKSKFCIYPTAIYLPFYYRYRMGEKLNLKAPKKLSEKLNWLKMHYHDPLYTIGADKYRMREYVKRQIGKGYTVPLLGKWDSVEEIDFDSLPNQFVLKTNHDGTPIICLDKSTFDIENARIQLNGKLKDDYYRRSREWCYKDIPRCIFAEELLGDGKEDLIDYKFWCFNGKLKYICTQSEHEDTKHNFAIDYFDLDFKHLPFKHIKYGRAINTPSKPKHLDKMIEISEKLSAFNGLFFPFVRVDLYEVNDKIYVGELTFYPTGGMVKYDPPEWNYTTGDYLNLPKGKPWKKRSKEEKQWIKDTLSKDFIFKE